MQKAHRPKWTSQLRALTIKNARLIAKKPLLLLFAILAPFAVFPLIAQLTDMFVTTLANTSSFGGFSYGSIPAQTLSAGTLPSLGKGSLIFVMSSNGSSSTSSRSAQVMQRLCAMTGLQMGSDVISFHDTDEVANSIITRYYDLQAAPVSGLVTWSDSDSIFSYTISTLSQSYTFDNQLSTLALQQAIDAAILSIARSSTSYTAGLDSYQISYDFFSPGSFGSDTLNIDNNDGDPLAGVQQADDLKKQGSSALGWFTLVLVASAGSLSFVPMMALVIEVIVKEKQRKLLGVLRRMGLMESAFWLSVFIPMIVVCILVSLGASAGVTLVYNRLPIFKVTFDVLFILHFCYALAITGMGCVIAATFSRPLYINLSLGFVTIACIVVNTVLFLDYSAALGKVLPPQAFWFTKCEAIYAKILLFIFAPFFNYGRVWADINIVNNPLVDSPSITRFDFMQLASTTRILPSISSTLTMDKKDLQTFQALPPTAVYVLFLFLTPIFYGILAWYLNQALPSLEGFSRPWHFPFMPSYWTGNPKRRVLSAGDTLALEKEKSAQTGTVRMVKLSKAYKGVTAVKEFSSVFNAGKVYSILGHNGAGKSTLINMLSLGTSPTFGDCFMFGLDIKEDAGELQNMMAMCPQFDVLYPSLTPNQHLQFYYSFRGDHKNLSSGQLKALFQEKLAAVNLADVANVPCSRFSGGMKRRLSLCLATVAESARIVFLDEPTTGLDPISRRGVWKVIQELKRDRVVILTTHSMHEADALGDHVCIMHQGRLRASGSSLFLKNKFGEGYQVTLVNRADRSPVASNDELRDAVESYVKYALPRSHIVSSAGGAMTVAVNKIERGRLVAFLRALKQDELMDWSIGNSTLEEVFLKLCTQNKAVVTEEEGGQATSKPICRICSFRPTEVVHLYTKAGVMIEIPDVICKICADNVQAVPVPGGNNEINESTVLVSFSEYMARSLSRHQPIVSSERDSLLGLGLSKAKTTVSSQLKAVMLKNLYLHSKEKKVNWCFIVFLILFVVVSVLAGQFLPRPPPGCNDGIFFTNIDDYGITCDPIVYSRNLQKGTRTFRPFHVDVACSDNNADCAGGLRSPFSFDYAAFAVLATSPNGFSPSVGNLVGQQIASFASGLSFMGSPANVLFSQNKATDDLDATTFFGTTGSNTSTKSDKITPGSSAQKIDATSVQAFFSTQQQKLISGEKSLTSACPSYARGQNLNGLVAADEADFAKQWNQYYPDLGFNFQKLKVDSSAININLQIVSYPRVKFPPIYIPSIAMLPGSIKGIFSDCVAIQHAVGQYDPYADPALGTFDQVFVSINSVTNKALQSFRGAPTVQALVNPLPEIIDIDTTRDFKFVIYKMGNGVFVMFFILTTALVYPRLVSLLVLEKKENLVEMMRIQGLNLPSYWAGNYLYGFCVIFLFNFLYAVIAYLAGIPQVTRMGVAYLFLIMLLWTHGQICLVFFIAGVVTKPTSSGLVSYLLYITAAGLAPFLILSVGSSGFSIVWNVFPVTGIMAMLQLVMGFGKRDLTRILTNAAVMFVCSTLLGLIGMYVHAIRPSSVGIPVDPLLGLSSLLGGRSTDRMKEKDIELIAARKDSDVAAHERAVQAFHARGTDAEPAVDPQEALRIVNLRKVFGKNKVAVQDMTLSFRLGETFGLLGPNGAGKTTALSMMTGLLKRTSGSIVINGKSIGPNKNARTEEIGVTPQFDTVWPEMTVEEHLKFYCRLRGIPKNAITGMVRSIAESIELDGDAFKQNASGLSGGMRRRLSIGIALTANPRILVLDEPTTGLDPETRRQIWTIVDKLRRSGDKCVIITTHSMDEADALCSRIGIVCDGAVRVLGTQLSLKKKFAEGLKFTFRFTVKVVNTAENSPRVLVNVEEARVSEITTEISRATGLRRLTWALISSDLTYACANAPLSREEEGISWMVSLQCIARETVDVAEAFLRVSQACDRLGVEDWALNETTLEDVFVKVVGA